MTPADTPMASTDPLIDAIGRWAPFTVAVIGDFMLDELVYGDAERLSPEAPVPVLRATRTERRAGGSANVCLDLAALGGRVRTVGLVGDDAEAGVLRARLERPEPKIGRGSVDASGMIADASRPTTVKRSLVGLAQARHPQKMFRLDMESTEPPSDAVTERLLAAALAAMDGADAICLEDYGKGVLTERLTKAVIAEARSRGVPVFVDPAGRGGYDGGYAKYAGASAITPNRTEAEAATGLRSSGESADASVNAAIATTLRTELDLDAVVLTLDKQGALLVTRDGEPAAVPTIARQVYDVTGAGDMMLAGLTAARCQGVSWDAATRFANAAAGLEVEVFGVMPIETERVWAELLTRDRERRGAGPVRTAEEIVIEFGPRRQAGERLVFTNGCFDVLHAGHVGLLEDARAHGDILVVAINADASVTKLKGEGRPVNSQADRAAVLGAMRAVDAVVVFEEDTPERLLEVIRPEVLVKGGDYTPEQVVGREIVRGYGGEVVVTRVLPGRSTTGALERILSL